MLRTWVVRLAASRLTLSVRSFQVPPTPGTTAWPPSRPSVPDLARHARYYFGRERAKLLEPWYSGVLEQQDLAAHVDW